MTSIVRQVLSDRYCLTSIVWKVMSDKYYQKSIKSYYDKYCLKSYDKLYHDKYCTKSFVNKHYLEKLWQAMLWQVLYDNYHPTSCIMHKKHYLKSHTMTSIVQKCLYCYNKFFVRKLFGNMILQEVDHRKLFLIWEYDLSVKRATNVEYINEVLHQESVSSCFCHQKHVRYDWCEN